MLRKVCVGGTWAYYRYRHRREHIWNIDLVPSLSIRAIDSQRTLVSLQLVVKNVGAQAFTPGNDGLQVCIRRVVMPSEGLVDWNNGIDVLPSMDILAKYKKVKDAPCYAEEYTLDVGASYSERIDVVLTAGYFYMFQTRLHGPGAGDYLTDYHLVEAQVADLGREDARGDAAQQADAAGRPSAIR